MIMAQSTMLQDLKNGKVERQSLYFNANILENHQSDGRDEIFKNIIDQVQTILFTYKSTSYVNIADYVELHITGL